jgi:hypothetical protein
MRNIKKRALLLALAIAMMLPMFNTPYMAMSTTAVQFNNPVNVVINGQQVTFPDASPTIVDGRTLVPIRAVFEALGFVVGWNTDIQTATMTRGSDTIVMTIGSAVFATNGIAHTLDVPAQIINGSTMVPIRSPLESVGYWVEWDSRSNTVIISGGPVMGLGGSVSAISTGRESSYVILDDGTLWAWGSNWSGQLAQSIFTNYHHNPVRIMDSVTAVSAGRSHVMAIREDGSLWVWGSNWGGQLGNDNAMSQPSPMRVMENVIAISAGLEHSMAIRNDGSLWAWGCNRDGKLGNGAGGENSFSSTPIRIMENVIAISAGHEHSMAIRSDGSLWAWGDNYYGQIGDGTQGWSRNPVKIMDDVIAISAGFRHSMAIKSDGSLWAWGVHAVRDQNGFFIEYSGVG